MNGGVFNRNILQFHLCPLSAPIMVDQSVYEAGKKSILQMGSTLPEQQ
jgi:hypothetical protein